MTWIDASYHTEDQRRTLILAWLNQARDTGRLVIDPLATSTVAAVHELYQEMNPDYQMSRITFGQTLNNFLPPAVRGSKGHWIRTGLRIVPAS